MPGEATFVISWLLSFTTLPSFYKPLPMMCLLEKRVSGEVNSLTKERINSSFFDVDQGCSLQSPGELLKILTSGLRPQRF